MAAQPPAGDPATARRAWRALEPYHGMIYFAPEAAEEYEAIGLERGPMGYFASRSAAMGPVPGEVVVATFYNFHPPLVHDVIPKAWSLASPTDVVAARRRAVDRALRRLVGDDVATRPEVAEALELARTASEGCTPQGRPLFAAHAALDWPSAPHVALWHAASLLREFRGDGHVAALVAEGIGPLTALVLHAATGEVPAGVLKATRAWPEEEWAAEVVRLRQLGWLGDDEALTSAGQAVRQRVEEATDAAAVAPYARLGADGCTRLIELGKQLSRLVVAAGALPGRR